MNLDQKLASPRLRLRKVFFDQRSGLTGISQAHRFHSSPLRLVNRSGTNCLLVEHGAELLRQGKTAYSTR
jgi:hypothetical protein